jgi:Ca2+-binding RTX toxin-like protein
MSAGMASSYAQQIAVANLYVALFNRAPDADGFSFWNQALESGVSLSAITGSFLGSPESAVIYPPSQSASEFISTLYRTVFGRAPDADGLAYWTDMLNAAGGVGSIAGKTVVVTEIIKVVGTPMPVQPVGMPAAQYTETFLDRDLFGRKGTVSIDFATNLKSNDLVLAKQVLAGLSRYPASDDSVWVDPSKTFTLTTSGDTFVGTAFNDTFNAPTFGGNGALTNSINTHDNLDGGAGIDALNVELGFVWREIPTLNGMEVVKVTTQAAGVMLDLRNATGVTHVGFADGVAGSDGLVYNVGAASLSVSNQMSNVAFTGSTAITLALSLKQVGAAGSLTTVDLARWGRGIGDDGSGDGAQATTHAIDMTNAYVALAETKASAAVVDVNVKAAGANALMLSVADAGTVKHLTVTGGGSVDFSGRTLSALETFVGGTGVEKLTVGNALAANARIALGAGDDTIVLARGSVDGARIDGGAGNDTIVTGAVTHAAAGGNVPVQIPIMKIGAATGAVDASVDTVSVTVLGREIVTDPVDIGNPIAVASAVSRAINAQGAPIANAVKASAFLDTVWFGFSGLYAEASHAPITYNGDVDGGHGTLNVSFSTASGTVPMAAAVGTVDTLTGGAGADTFVFTTADIANQAGAVTAVITDFQTGVDRIVVSNAGAGAGQFMQAGSVASTLADLLTTANAALDGATRFYVGQVGGDAYLVTDIDGLGYTNVIKLAGVGLSGVAASDLYAA